MASKFHLLKRLGSGHFGLVWRTLDKTLNQERALKLIPPDKVPDPNNFFREAQILSSAQHANIVRVHEAGTYDDGRLYVAMEYLEKGSLEDEARGGFVPLTRAKRIMVDVLRGLQHAHTKGIVHRDIKPANILVGPAGEGKLSDFGLALVPSRATPVTGPLAYVYVSHLAPEAFGSTRFSSATDIYACGVTLYRLINGDSYLPAIPPSRIAKEARLGRFPDRGSYRDFIPTSLRRLVNKAMSVDPAKRFASAEALRRALEQIDINMNWGEHILPDRRRWGASWGRRCYEVETGRTTHGKWYVRTRKGPSKTRLRRITDLCRTDLTKAAAERATRRILQDFVLGRVK